MKFQNYFDTPYRNSPTSNALSSKIDLTSKPPVSTHSYNMKGFVSSTGMLALFVAVMLLGCIAILASQIWRNNIHGSEVTEILPASQLNVVDKIQIKKPLQGLQNDINANTVISIGDTTGTVSKADAVVINEQIPEIQLEPTTDTVTSADNKPLAFKGDPAIYNQTISGRVLTSAGDILPEIVVTASQQPQPRDAEELLNDVADSAMRRLQVQSNLEGEFVFEQLKPGLYRISARLQDGDDRSSLVVQSGVEMVDLIMPVLQSAEIIGQVADEIGIPLEGVSVRLVPGKAQAHSDAQGKFILSGSLSEDQSYQIKFNMPNYESTYLNVSGASLMDNDPQSQISARMNSITGVTTITGRITDIKGNLLSGQHVRLASPETNFRESVYTDQFGEFRFEQIIAGSDYQLSVSSDEGYRPWIQKDIDITPASRYFELVLERNRSFARLHGRVIGPDGDPIPHFNFTVKAKKAGLNTVDATSDASGRYSVSDIPAGPVQIRRKGEPDLTLVNLYLEGDEARELDIPVDWGVNSLSGRVIDTSGTPVKGARIKLSWNSSTGRVITQTYRKRLTDADGRFQFTNLGPGQRSLLISSSLIEPVTKKVTIGHDRSIPVVVKRSI